MSLVVRTAVALSVLVLAAACGAAPSGVEDVSADEVLALVSTADGPLLLDVRTPGEYAGGHVPGATNIPHDQVPSRLAELEPYQERGVVVYCQSGKRAGVAADALVAAGFSVRHLDGDMQGWRAQGRAEEK